MRDQSSFKGQDRSRIFACRILRSLGLVRTFQQTRIYAKDELRRQYADLGAPPSPELAVICLAGRHRTEMERAEHLLEFVGLYRKRLLAAGDLSFGQQKLLEFAMALMNEPEILLLDEPTAGINPTLINGLIDRLKRANTDFGITLFVIEHNMRVIMNMADRVHCLAHGELLASGPPDEIQNDQRVIDAYLGAH